MRTPWFLLAAAAAATAITGCRSAAIDDRANERINDAHAAAVRRAFSPTCPEKGVVSGNCGLVLKRAATEDFRVKFRDLKCVDKDTATCETLYQRMLDATLKQRYRLADWDEVALTCDANPGKCDDPVAYELLLVDSHNVRVRDDYAREEQEIENERRHAHSRHAATQVAAAGALVGTVAAVAVRGPVCHSYPSAFTDVTMTVCSP